MAFSEKSPGSGPGPGSGPDADHLTLPTTNPSHHRSSSTSSRSKTGLRIRDWVRSPGSGKPRHPSLSDAGPALASGPDPEGDASGDREHGHGGNRNGGAGNAWWKIQLFRGMVNDVRKRAPYYWSDWADAWNYRVVPATVYMFFAKSVSSFPNLMIGLTDERGSVSSPRWHSPWTCSVCKTRVVFVHSRLFGESLCSRTAPDVHRLGSKQLTLLDRQDGHAVRRQRGAACIGAGGRRVFGAGVPAIGDCGRDGADYRV